MRNDVPEKRERVVASRLLVLDAVIGAAKLSTEGHSKVSIFLISSLLNLSTGNSIHLGNDSVLLFRLRSIRWSTRLAAEMASPRADHVAGSRETRHQYL